MYIHSGARARYVSSSRRRYAYDVLSKRIRYVMDPLLRASRRKWNRSRVNWWFVPAEVRLWTSYRGTIWVPLIFSLRDFILILTVFFFFSCNSIYIYFSAFLLSRTNKYIFLELNEWLNKWWTLGNNRNFYLYIFFYALHIWVEILILFLLSIFLRTLKDFNIRFYLY